ncbi:MAG: hypothetical protein KGJ78_10480 [Alphaproteobacteria bacterium]|nr:hypothetical protein [Alphaproteobacteria bacterium]
MTIKNTAMMAGACVLAFGLVAGQAEARKVLKCAGPEEVTAMQAAAVQQELMDAALTCGDDARVAYNAFQTSFGPELRRSDSTMLRMFKRVLGSSRGDKAYNLFKTELAAKAELRRVHGNADFCSEAKLVAAAALAPDKPALSDFVSGIPVADISGGGVDRCDVQVQVTLRGAMAAPSIVPTPNPLRDGALSDPPPVPNAVQLAAPVPTPPQSAQQ